MANSLASSENRNGVAGIAALSNTHYGGVRRPDAYNAAISAEKSKMGVSEIQEIANKLLKLQLRYPQNFELIEDTLLIHTSIIGKRKLRNKKRQERDNNKKKKQQRKRYVKKKRRYSREELEALRFDDLDGQKKNWAAVHGGLLPVVAAEYDGLLASPNKNRRPDFDVGAAMGRNIFVQ